MGRKKQNKSELNDPVVPYKKELKLDIYNSFEEMNEANIKEMADLTPQERIKNAVELSLRVYNIKREDWKKRKEKMKLKIVKGNDELTK